MNINSDTPTPTPTLPDQAPDSVPSSQGGPSNSTDYKARQTALEKMEEYKREDRTCISCYRPLCCCPRIRAEAPGNQGGVDIFTLLANTCFCCFPCFMCAAGCAAR
ncbi:MAG: hypothetical protein AAGG81_08750 [Chlamydiota bacterium]